MDFTHTTAAAAGHRQPTWEVVEAIAADALDAGGPILSTATMTATGDALTEAGMPRSLNVVGRLMELAQWHHDATDGHREVYRAHSPALVTLLVMAGWTQADAAAFLVDRPKVTHAEVRAEVNRRTGPPAINVVGHKLLHAIGNWFMDAANFANRAEAEGGLDAYSASVVELYHALTEKRIDAELRQLLDADSSSEAPSHDPAAPLSEADWRALMAAGDLEAHDDDA